VFILNTTTPYLAFFLIKHMMFTNFACFHVLAKASEYGLQHDSSSPCFAYLLQILSNMFWTWLEFFHPLRALLSVFVLILLVQRVSTFDNEQLGTYNVICDAFASQSWLACNTGMVPHNVPSATPWSFHWCTDIVHSLVPKMRFELIFVGLWY
jgi:hypothetical protein